MTTEQLALVVTGVVGLAGVVSPAILRWVDRGHERELARSQRLHAQRLEAYVEVARFIERQRRAMAEWVESTTRSSDDPHVYDDWIDMRGRYVTVASKEVATGLDQAMDAALAFYVAVVKVDHLPEPIGHPSRDEMTTLAELMAAMSAALGEANEAFDAAEERMNEELANL